MPTHARPTEPSPLKKPSKLADLCPHGFARRESARGKVPASRRSFRLESDWNVLMRVPFRNSTSHFGTRQSHFGTHSPTQNQSELAPSHPSPGKPAPLPARLRTGCISGFRGPASSLKPALVAGFIRAVTCTDVFMQPVLEHIHSSCNVGMESLNHA